MTTTKNEFTYKKSWLSWPIVRHLRAMHFRRLKPFRDGRSESLSVIRYYWYSYLDQHRPDIKGRALEIGNTKTISYYGGQSLTQADALDLTAHSPEVKVVADLSRADHIPSNQYDCFVNQFTTSVVYDIEAMLYHSIRLLKPGGILLINFWCLDYYLYRGLIMDSGLPLFMYWWFTPIHVENLIHQMKLSQTDYQLDIYGNMLTRMAFLMNVDAHEFTRKELDFQDPGQPLLICARIVKPQNWQAQKPAYKNVQLPPTSHNPVHASPDTGHYGDVYQ